MTEQTTPQLLREIADVMEERPDDGFQEFQHAHFGKWSMYHGWENLIEDAYLYPERVRRRPRTIKVSGEVSERVVNNAGMIEEAFVQGSAEYEIARALLDLIENGGG